MFRSEFQSFLTALSFLTRLGPAARFDPDRLPHATAWFPAVGFVIGLLTWAVTLAPLPDWSRAWAIVVLNVWVARGLHHDGLGDVADGWGSGATGERFWEIVKDSRAGAFAVLALVLETAGRLVLTHDLLASGQAAALIFVPVFGRLACVWLAEINRRRVRPGLAGLFLNDRIGRARVWIASLAVLGLGLATVRPLGLLLAALAASVVLWRLSALARQKGGLNGDFLGAAVLLSELAALLALVAGTR